MIRLQKFISDCGYCSRRKAEEIILGHRVKVNGRVCAVLGKKVDEKNDNIMIDGERLRLKVNPIYIVLNKPRGYITSVSDERGRKTVMDLLPDVKERVYPVGRLDCDSEGMLILTNDGDFAYKMTHPKHNIEKTYITTINGVPKEEELERLLDGIKVDGVMVSAKKVLFRSSKDDRSKILITITDGKNRQVRKMFEAIKYKVLRLKRVKIGGLELQKIPLGEYRYLTNKELELLYKGE